MKFKLMVWMMFALIVSYGAAWAQQAGSTPSAAAMPLGAPEMLANFVTSWLLPVVVIPFILQSHWTETRKRIWSASVCFFVALLTTIVNQKYSFHLIPGATIADQIGNFGSWFLINATIILSATKILFTNFWRDTGLPDKLEAATSAKPTKAQTVNKQIDKAQSVITAIDTLKILLDTKPEIVPKAAAQMMTAPPQTQVAQNNLIPPAPPTLEPFPEANDGTDEEAQQLFATIMPQGGAN